MLVCPHIESIRSINSNQLTEINCTANQLTGFYMRATLAFNELRTLIRQAYTVCLNGVLLREALHHIETFFTEYNGCPTWVLKLTLDSFENKSKNHDNNINNENHNDTDLNRLYYKVIHTLKLPYKGDYGTNLIKSTKSSTKKSLLEKHDVRNILTGTKLSSQFNTKDDTNKQHKHDFTYFSRCTDSYIEETARRLSERVMDHAG